MIITFSVSNFRSFDSEQTFSMAASGRVSETHEDHVVSVGRSEIRLLRAAILYGANGAGKSNLFAALKFFRDLAIESQPRNAGTFRTPFRLGADRSSERPTSFDLQFAAGQKIYRYGLKLDDTKILEEWLVEVKKSSENALFERITDPDGKVRVSSKGLKSLKPRFKALCEVGGMPNQSFLATVFNILERDDIHPEISTVITWLVKDLVLIGPDEPFRPLGMSLSSDEKFKAFASDFLRGASTGVDSLEVSRKEISEQDARQALPETAHKRMLSSIEEESEGIGAIIGDGAGDELLVEKNDGVHFYQLLVNAIHKSSDGRSVNFLLPEESDGTRRLLNLLPALYALRGEDAVFVIDEIDRSLHPILVRKFLEFFLRSCGGRRHQLVITTHESNLLDLELVRRDEVWFAEKDSKSATHLYSLDDFGIRTDLKIRRHYLDGRFGAVPLLGTLDELMGERE